MLVFIVSPTHRIIVQHDANLWSNASACGKDVAVYDHFPCGSVQDVVRHQVAQALDFLNGKDIVRLLAQISLPIFHFSVQEF